MTVVCRGYVLMLVALLGEAAEPAAARWEGAVQIPGNPLRLVIDLAQDGQGQWAGSAIFPDLGIKGAPLIDISVHETEVSFTVKDALAGPKLRGHLAPDGVFTGEFQQAGNTASFTVRKAGPPQVDPPRQSTPVRKELEGDWQGEMTFVGNHIQVKLSMANQAGGSAKGKLVLIGRRETVLPIDLVTQESDLLSVEVLAASMTFEGRLRKDANEIAGTFQQGPFEAGLVLRRK
jgi:hypothetical protein